MSPYKKNILVGLTVLVALILLGWMILRFSDAPFAIFKQEQMPVHFVATAAEGIGEGSPISYRGVVVGRVSQVRLNDDNLTVRIDALMDTKPQLPANVQGLIRSQLIGGGASIYLVLAPVRNPASAATNPVTQPSETQPVGTLEPGQEIHARFVGIDILPPEFTSLATDLKATSEELRLIGQEVRQSNMIPKLADTVTSLKATVERAGNTIDSVQSLVTDEQMRADLRQTMANFRATSDSAGRIAANLEKITAKVDTRVDQIGESADARLTQLGSQLEQVANILRSFESAAAKLDQGKGSAAMLLNDPRLYENLYDTSRQLSETIATFRRLVEQWEQEGLHFKLK
jgi:phospholipid/cholesterol/gamma-HCH transport system substrate-binding protein